MDSSFRIFFASNAKVGKWIVRVDKPRTSNKYDQLHVHVTRSKLKGEYSWNLDGSRHDKHRFPTNEHGIVKAKELAAEALNAPVHTLQLLTVLPDRFRLSIHSIDDCGKDRNLFTTYVRSDETAVLFGTQSGLVMITLPTSATLVVDSQP